MYIITQNKTASNWWPNVSRSSGLIGKKVLLRAVLTKDECLDIKKLKNLKTISQKTL
jgi:hypothetical protein